MVLLWDGGTYALLLLPLALVRTVGALALRLLSTRPRPSPRASPTAATSELATMSTAADASRFTGLPVHWKGRGSHRVYAHPARPGHVVVPHHGGRDLPPGTLAARRVSLGKPRVQLHYSLERSRIEVD